MGPSDLFHNSVCDNMVAVALGCTADVEGCGWRRKRRGPCKMEGMKRGRRGWREGGGGDDQPV